jgi:hypothetical protein
MVEQGARFPDAARRSLTGKASDYLPQTFAVSGHAFPTKGSMKLSLARTPKASRRLQRSRGR